MNKRYRYPTELIFDSFWQGFPDKHTANGRDIRFPVENTDYQKCAVCGRNDFEIGFNTYESTLGTSRLGSVISNNFGEQFFFTEAHSPVTCPFCESVVRPQFKDLNGIVANPASAFLIVGKGKEDNSDPRIKRILSGDYYRLMLEPPEPPFIFAFNKNGVGKNGTHFIYLSTINYSRDQYVIGYYDEKIMVDRQFLLEVWERIVQKDPSKNVMSTAALMSGLRAKKIEKMLTKNTQKGGQDTKGTSRKNGAKEFIKSKSYKIFEASAFSSDPGFLARALLQDNFRTMGLFFMSIASFNVNNKKKNEEVA
jgi:hypothetical protein